MLFGRLPAGGAGFLVKLAIMQVCGKQQEGVRQYQVEMLYGAIVCLVIAIIAGVLGFGGIAGTAAGFAKILFFIFLVLLVVSLLFNMLRGKGPKV